MNKKQNAATNGMTLASSPYRGLLGRGVVKSSSGEAIPAGSVSGVHPYKIPQPQSSIAKYDSDFPLRKTGGFINLVCVFLVLNFSVSVCFFFICFCCNKFKS